MNEPIFSMLNGKPCGTVSLSCQQMGPDPINDTGWSPSNINMDGCGECSPYTSDPGPTTPCTIDDTYTYTYYCS